MSCQDVCLDMDLDGDTSFSRSRMVRARKSHVCVECHGAIAIGEPITSFAPEPYPGYLGWERVDCGCCAGLEWGGSEPRECKDCGGGGSLAKHTASGILALYPGGPARGREAPSR